ncbi:hypothetical protein E3Q17_03107 [Wallemia mellicola]|uniref:snRNA-activating protein complex subunit 3 n=1 Tax=Wallemia mellicola TaxID=1708541 RepID=A0A4T0NLZ6_9BASI|nr:hypothetical protein E3Q17_03107 [Wallemia mellicola]TIC09856.1 hypothetical protein E3Q14_03153 [Wallemia mellicola]
MINRFYRHLPTFNEKNSYGPSSQAIDIDSFINHARSLNRPTIDNDINEDIINQQIEDIRKEDDKMLSSPTLLQSIKDHSDRYKNRRKPKTIDKANEIKDIFEPPQRCFQHDSMTEYYMRNTDEGDVNAAETQSIDARGKNWDYSTVVIEVESKVPTLNGILERTDVVLLSSKHTLGHLRDKLKCEADGAPYASSNKSSCFVFEAVAYLDKRKEGWETYEESVKQLSLRDISTKSIENVPLGELPIRTGRFGWMVHSGGCEHALQITGVRLKGTRETLPRYKFSKLDRTQKPICGICDKKQAALITYKDRLGAENSTYWCDICFDNIHQGFNTNDLNVYPVK